MKVLVKRQNTQTSSSLFHSSTYYGQEFDDGLRHWKYIKREKLPDGKYRYWYDEYSSAKDVASKQKAFMDVAKKPIDPYANENLKDAKVKGINVEDAKVKRLHIKDAKVEGLKVKAAEVKGIKFTGKPTNVDAYTIDRSTLKAKVADFSYKFTKKIASGEKWIYNNVLNTKFGNTLATAIGKASEKVSSFFNLFSKDKKGPSIFDQITQPKISTSLNTVTKMALNQVKQQKMTAGANAVSNLMRVGGVVGNGAKRNANNPLKQLEDPRRISTYEPTKYEVKERLKDPRRNSTYQKQSGGGSRHADNNDRLERLENPMRTGTYQKQSGSGSRHAETVQGSGSRHVETVQGAGSRHENSNQKTNTLARLADPRRNSGGTSEGSRTGGVSGRSNSNSNTSIFGTTRNTTLNSRISAIEIPDSVKNIDIFGTSNKKLNGRRR